MATYVANFAKVSYPEAARIMAKYGTSGGVDVYGVILRAGDRVLPSRPRLVLACVGDSGLIFLNESREWGVFGAVYAATEYDLRAEAGPGGVLNAYEVGFYSARGIAKLAEYELAFIQGVFGASSLAGFAVMAAAGIVEFTVENGRHLRTTARVLGPSLEAFFCLVSAAPRTAWWLGKTSLLSSLPKVNVSGPDLSELDAFSVIGYTITKLARAAQHARGTKGLGIAAGATVHIVVELCWATFHLMTVIAKIATSTQVVALDGPEMRQFEDGLRRAGANIPDDEKRRILNEIQSNRQEVERCLRGLPAELLQGL